MASEITSPFDLVARGIVHIAGGIPSPNPDIIVCAVLLPFYAAGAAGNVFLFRRYGAKLKWQMACFGYCMSRLLYLSLRIGWAKHRDNSDLATAGTVFLNAGTLLLILINLMMSKKIIFRTHYDYFQSHPQNKVILKKIFSAFGFFLLPVLAITITGAVQGLLTLDPTIQKDDTILKKLGITVFFIYSCFPFIILAVNAVLRLRGGASHAEDGNGPPGLGTKRWTSNWDVWQGSAIILLSATLLIFEYAIKLVQAYGNSRQPAWHYGKAAFYCTAILPELLSMYTLLLSNMGYRYAGLSRAAARGAEDHERMVNEKPAKNPQ